MAQARLYAGSLIAQGDFDAPPSMAREIDAAIAAVVGPFPPGDPTYRRRLFIALAKGVIKHLKEKEQAFDVQVGFTYADPAGPVVTAVTPPRGSITGGQTVTITGTGFAAGAAVSFGGNAATGVTVSGDGTSITAVTPAHTAGTVDVVVTNPGGSSGTLTHRGYPTVEVQP